MKRLLLAGGGHAHLEVLARWGRAPVAGWQVELVSPHAHQLYSGMLPGWIAGHYPLQACRIALAPLARAAGATFHQASVARLDAQARQVALDDGRTLAFDALSLDVGPAPALDGLAPDGERSVAMRPLTALAAHWPPLMERIASQCRPFHLVVVGAGAGGLELALAARHRGMREGWSHLQVTLLGADGLPLPGAPAAARRLALRLLAQRCIAWHGGARAEGLQGDRLLLAHGASLPFDACWLATGAAAPAWLRASGLALDAQGFVRVGADLQSVSHRGVFAAGDVAALPCAAPKSGVYAVRAGPPLARNLRHFCEGLPLGAWAPQRHALYLVGTGDRRALGWRGGLVWQGRWAWWCKDRIDRAFVARYARGGD